MSSAPQAAEPSTPRFDPRRLFADNPVAVLSLVVIGLFVATDIVNRVQSSEAFLTPKHVSTTFLYAAILGLMSAGQTLVLLTGGLWLIYIVYRALNRKVQTVVITVDASGRISTS